MQPLVTIAIPDLSGSVARNITLQAIARHTPQPHEIVLLVEEPGSSRSLAQMGYQQNVRQLAVPKPFNIPVALNRVVMTCTTPYILLLESGTIVTSGWLERLLEPLEDATVGLSGPSTNASWNEQKVLTGSDGIGWSVQQIDAYAAQVASQYSNQRHLLDTLHSLGDFCYLFKRAVAEQLGGFDEAYGAGPCWEIDFNTRAARAGFQAIWVADAYVHRGPESAWKVTSLRRHFTASKQLYQDRFCGLRLQGKKTDYEPHCRGELCEHFAPPALIQVTLRREGQDNVGAGLAPALPALIETNGMPALIETTPPALIETNRRGRFIAPTADLSALSSYGRGDPCGRPVGLAPALDLPLVSCIMPTRNRRVFVQHALAYFERQDYPNRELVIVDDGTESVADLVSAHPRVRYVSLPRQTSIGAKRNVACETARGAIIAHWDDDDWYAPHRLRYQVAPLLAKAADITGLETSCFFDLTRWQVWTCTPALHNRLFVGDVHGGTLVYWRKVWERLARYPSASLAEDAFFLRDARQRGARLQKLPHAHSFVYLRHSSNAWSFPLGSYLDASGWQQTDLNNYLPAADLPFYAALSPSAPALPSPEPRIEQPHTAPASLVVAELASAISRPTSTTSTASTTSPNVELASIISPNFVTPVEHRPPSTAIVGAGLAPALGMGSHEIPLVSCIMPTSNRRNYVPQAIQYFLRQDYPQRELLILDDGSEPVNDLVPADPRIHYIRLEKRMILGAKRNLACKLAQGSIIAHWDDDDWIAPHRLRYQVEMLEQQQKDVCGTGRLLFYSPATGKSWLYEYPATIRRWLAGGTLCYRKDFWLHTPFPEIAKGEDTRFVWNPKALNALTVPDYTFYVALVHSANTSQKMVNSPYWHPHPVEEIYRLLGPDLSFYRPE
jgi:glycosyltransferase involved in cell wall biosynthesis